MKGKRRHCCLLNYYLLLKAVVAGDECDDGISNTPSGLYVLPVQPICPETLTECTNKSGSVVPRISNCRPIAESQDSEANVLEYVVPGHILDSWGRLNSIKLLVRCL